MLARFTKFETFAEPLKVVTYSNKTEKVVLHNVVLKIINSRLWSLLSYKCTNVILSWYGTCEWPLWNRVIVRSPIVTRIVHILLRHWTEDRLFKMAVYFHLTAQHYIPEDINLEDRLVVKCTEPCDMVMNESYIDRGSLKLVWKNYVGWYWS
jgi:hypothetical protein